MSEVDEWGLPKHFESSKIQVAGLVVCEYSPKPSHWRSVKSLGDWLKAEGIPAVCGVDTRSLTKRLRAHGTMLGKIEGEGQSVELVDPNTRNLVAEGEPLLGLSPAAPVPFQSAILIVNSLAAC